MEPLLGSEGRRRCLASSTHAERRRCASAALLSLSLLSAALATLAWLGSDTPPSELRLLPKEVWARDVVGYSAGCSLADALALALLRTLGSATAGLLGDRSFCPPSPRFPAATEACAGGQGRAARRTA